MNIAFPLHFDPRGWTAQSASDNANNADDDAHIREMIEQLLFTAPGERVNRPDFGVGLAQIIFAPNSAERAAATQFSVQGALQRWLGDVIDVREATVEAEEATLTIKVVYIVRRTSEQKAFTFVKSGI